MASILDLATVLMPQGAYNSNQSFPALQLYPRQLGTSVVTISLQSPPTASTTFTVEEASTAGGTFTPIGRLTWPAGLIGSKDVEIGVSANAAWRQNNTAQWLRLSLTTTTSLTGSAWLSKPGGAGGTGSDVNDVLTGSAA
jgi:hypothetical protein